MTQTVRQIVQRLSLREPQARSLEILDEVCELLQLKKNADLDKALEAVRERFSTVQNFERDFPSLCFALATGVGKTRLMGAFISYLFRTKRSRHFLVLAPNLTIYRKLIEDFTPGTSKYVFQGIAEFATTQPVVITGESYERVRLVQDVTQGAFWDTTEAHINIFNIAKLGTKEGRKVSQLRETLGESYFQYLAALPDLVLLMDESHRYRAKAGVRTINELKPVLGLELTATPRVETGGGKEFQNVIYRFDLADALDHGFVKTPAVGTRENFSAKDRTDDELETIKLQDGIRMHEETKVHLQTYALQTGEKRVKPFVLVIARDTVHAESLRRKIESADFFGGQYAGKAITVHSNQSGEEADQTVEQLLAVEDAANATEIVIHVNMLKEGWDVRNLYTVIPLRAANSRTLVEQSIGRGLRLPYGKRTGVPEVDRLTIVAHDRFQEIVDFARGKDSPLRREMEVRFVPPTPTQAVTEPPKFAARVVDAQSTPERQAAAELTLRVIRDFETLRSSEELEKPEVQARISERVAKLMVAEQGELPGVLLGGPEIAAVVARTTDRFRELTIDIPKITVTPVDDQSGYRDFNLDLSGFRQQPSSEAILIQDLHGDGRTVMARGGGQREISPEHLLVRELIGYNEISYDVNSELLFKLAGQAMAHLRSYLPDEDAMETVLDQNRRALAELIRGQMLAHFEERASGYHVTVNRGFQSLNAEHYPVADGQAMVDYRDPVEDKQAIPKMLFGGFERCLYGRQKFSTDPERRFAVVLERDSDVLKWYKPGRNDFQIYYDPDSGYEPDFVVETRGGKFLCEPKRATDLQDKKVQAKARAARTWCERASGVSAKPWKYLLIPHDQIAENRTFGHFVLNCVV